VKEEKLGQITVADRPEGDLAPSYAAYDFVLLSATVICRLYKLTLPDQAQVTRQLKDSLSDLV
jgi:hypothetical protein